MLTLQLLGTPRIEHNTTQIATDTRKTLALLSYLAITKQPHTREWLASFFWPESDSERARGALRYTLASLRRSISKANLISNRKTVALNPEADILVDVQRFEQLLESDDPASWEQAFERYHGDFMTGFTLPDAPLFDEWQYFERERLRRLMLDRLRTRIASGTPNETTLSYAHRWIAFDPYDEAAHRSAIALHHQLGQRDAALRQYDKLVQLLETELGVQPTDALQQWVQSLVAAPLKTPVVQHHSLPSYPDKFIGREQELAQLASFLGDPSRRLTTLVGYGGIGKTRLAVEAGKQFDGNVYFVSLVAANSAETILSAIASALDLSLIGAHDTESALIDALRERPLLLILDNFEQLVATETSFVARWLDKLPQLQMLVTSRIRLNLRHERTLRILGLNAAQENTDGSAALDLFIERAREQLPDFSYADNTPSEQAAMLRLCDLTEGMPLALELAATWVHMLSCERLVIEIERNAEMLVGDQADRPARHHHIRAVFEYSWALLSPPLREMLAQIGVLHGTFSLEAATSMAGATLRGLSSLVDHSLLTPVGQDRYRLHVLLRQYALEKLGDARAEQIAHQHADYYAALFERHQADFKGKRYQEAFRMVSAEMANIRAAWMWSIRNESLFHLDTMLAGLQTFYITQNRYRDGVSTFSEAIRVLRPLQNSSKRILARLLIERGIFRLMLGELANAQSDFHAALDYGNKLDDNGIRLAATRAISIITRQRGDYATSKRFALQTIALSQASFQQLDEAFGHGVFGINLLEQGEFEEAADALHQSSELFSALGYDFGLSQGMLYQGEMSLLRGFDGTPFFMRSLALSEQVGDTNGEARATISLSRQASAKQDYAAALQWIKRAMALRLSPYTEVLAVRQHAAILMAKQHGARAIPKLQQALRSAIALDMLPLAIALALDLTQCMKLGPLSDWLIAAAKTHPSALWETRRIAEQLADEEGLTAPMVLPIRELLRELLLFVDGETAPVQPIALQYA